MSERRFLELRVGRELAELVVARLEAANHSQLLVVRVVRRGGLDRDLYVTARVGQARVRAFGELTTPEAFVTAPGLKVARERFIQAPDAGADVHDGSVDLADDIHARLSAQPTHPLGIGFATIADGAVRR